MSERFRLLLLRHGTAVPGSSDPGLSTEGRSGVEATLRHSRLAGCPGLDLLLHSPLRRAVETAELVAARMPPSRTRSLPDLLPDADPASTGGLLVHTLAEGAFPDTHAVRDTHEDPGTHAVPDTRGVVDTQAIPDTHVAPDLAPAAAGPIRRLGVVAHLPLLPALGRWLCDAELDFSTGCGWILEGEPDLAWQGTLSVIGRVDDGGMR